MIFFNFILIMLICCTAVQITAKLDSRRRAVYRRRNVHPEKKIIFPNNTKTLNNDHIYHPYNFIVVVIAIFFVVVVFV